jgi:hypothetical protein
MAMMGTLAERATERLTRLIRCRAMGLMAGAREAAGELLLEDRFLFPCL